MLVAGLCGLGAEVTKNLVLSGVKSLTMLDHRKVTQIDTCANFLAPHETLGENVGNYYFLIEMYAYLIIGCQDIPQVLYCAAYLIFNIEGHYSNSVPPV